MSDISLKNIEKVYDNGFHAVHNFNLDIKDKEFIVFVGPSGCGKSTTLRMIAGLEEITRGTLTINGKVVNSLPPKERGIAMVFQSYALYPHLSVYENLAFGLKLAGFDEDEIEGRVKETAKIMGLSEYLDRKPRNLSGGQRQRVALGRAVIRHADVFLMDEPLSNLDAKMRVSMRAELVRIHRLVGATTIYVTHDQIEAMTMATRIVVMKLGRIQQVGTPADLYFRPANLFVAGFIGDPPMNFLRGKIQDKKFVSDGTADFDFGKHLVNIVKKAEGKEVVIGFRPEDIVLMPKQEEDVKQQQTRLPDVVLNGKVEITEMLGDTMNIYVTMGDNHLIIRTTPSDDYNIGDPIEFGFNFDKLHVFDGETELVITNEDDEN